MLPNVVLFQGTDASGQIGLWETNGTAFGTFELAGIAGAGPLGLIPLDLTAFDGEVLFQGRNASDQFGLWTTNGTAAGTLELTGIVGANADGVDPSSLTIFNGQVLFNGTDTGGLLDCG